MATQCIFASTCKGGACKFCDRKCDGTIGSNFEIIKSEEVQVYDENMACAVTELYQKSQGNDKFKPTFVNVTKEELEAVLSGNKVLVINNSTIIAIGDVDVKEREPFRVERESEAAEDETEEQSDDEEAEVIIPVDNILLDKIGKDDAIVDNEIDPVVTNKREESENILPTSIKYEGKPMRVTLDASKEEQREGYYLNFTPNSFQIIPQGEIGDRLMQNSEYFGTDFQKAFDAIKGKLGINTLIKQGFANANDLKRAVEVSR